MARKSAGGGGRKARPEAPDDAWAAVTLEPKPGCSDTEVVAALRDAGASEVEVLAPGFVSARAPVARIEALRAVAEVHAKARKQMH